jgi:cell division protein FtsL
MDATGYALQKVVHNKAIIREVDELRQREMWQWAWMGLVLVAVLVACVWLHIGLLWQRGYGMETLQRQRAAEEEKTRQLQLEVARLSSGKRIEEFATTRLHMVPGLNDAIVIPRAIAPQRPPSSVVARR